MRVLVINSGSSSVKTKFIQTSTGEVLSGGTVECAPGGPEGAATDSPTAAVAGMVSQAISAASEVAKIEAVGHRMVHGGAQFTQPVLLDDAVMAGLEQVLDMAPLQNPATYAGMKAAISALPGVPQAAVFDTAFHATLPPEAYRYALPDDICRKYAIRRYGFHGTSHQYISGKAGEWLAAHGVSRPHRVVTLHLGNGSSAAAILDGKSMDTSMGFTPLEGLVMGTRSGDLDPSILPFLMDHEGWDPARIQKFMNEECGLLGASGLSADMREIEKAANEGHAGAAGAFDLFCYCIKKYVGAYTAVLGGLDALVFSGGIGENSVSVRRRVLQGLDWLGLSEDATANEGAEKGIRLISTADRHLVALVIPTDEESLIAAQTADLVSNVKAAA